MSSVVTQSGIKVWVLCFIVDDDLVICSVIVARDCMLGGKCIDDHFNLDNLNI